MIYWIRDALGDESDPSPNFLVATTTTNSITLTGLQSGTTYFWTVRNVCDNISLQSDLSTFSSFLTGGTVRCEDPSNLTITYSSTGTPSFSCDPSNGATEYRFAYHQVGSPDEWVEIIQTDNPVFTPPLTSGAEYEWGIRTICDNDNTVSQFLFGANYQQGDRCRVPRNLRSFERNIGMILRWNRRTEAVSYDLQIRVQGTAGWWTFNSPWWAVLLNGTVPGVTYEWRVRSVCDVNGSFVSEYSTIESFTPSANPALNSSEFEQVVDTKGNFSESLTTGDLAILEVQTLYEIPFTPEYTIGPNPARDVITIDPLSAYDIKAIQMVDINGRVVQVPVTFDAQTWKLRVSELARGLYFLKISTGYEQFIERVVIH